jgi:ZPR1 zinc finger protein
LGQGETRLLLTRIPHFREVVIMAFECPHCHFRNNEIQSAGALAEKGCTYTCHVVSPADLDRQIVRSEWATVRVPALDFEVPPTQERGSLTTLEGFLTGAVAGLELQQPARQAEDADLYAKIDAFLTRFRALLTLATPFDLVLDDPSGTSYIENLCVGVHAITRSSLVRLTTHARGHPHARAHRQAAAARGSATARAPVRAHAGAGPAAGAGAAGRGGGGARCRAPRL